jgi:hypothetical protein
MHYSTPIAVTVVLLSLAGFYFFILRAEPVTTELPQWVTELESGSVATSTPSLAETQPIVGSTKVRLTPGVERWYTNDDPQFTFQLPDGYTAPDIDTLMEGVHGVHVSNGGGSELTVYVYPATGMQVDVQTIRSYLAPQTVSDIRETVLGTVVRGYLFTSRHPDGLQNINLWAPYNGRVYTVQAPIEDVDLFAFITQRWFFAPATPSAPRN